MCLFLSAATAIRVRSYVAVDEASALGLLQLHLLVGHFEMGHIPPLLFVELNAPVCYDLV